MYSNEPYFQYDPKWLVLEVIHGYGYEVDLEQDDMTGWFTHLRDTKVWFTSKVAAAFIATCQQYAPSQWVRRGLPPELENVETRSLQFHPLAMLILPLYGRDADGRTVRSAAAPYDWKAHDRQRQSRQHYERRTAGKDWS